MTWWRSQIYSPSKCPSALSTMRCPKHSHWKKQNITSKRPRERRKPIASQWMVYQKRSSWLRRPRSANLMRRWHQRILRISSRWSVALASACLAATTPMSTTTIWKPKDWWMTSKWWRTLFRQSSPTSDRAWRRLTSKSLSNVSIASSTLKRLSIIIRQMKKVQESR